jgi:hypothetical protein
MLGDFLSRCQRVNIKQESASESESWERVNSGFFNPEQLDGFSGGWEFELDFSFI